MKKFLEIVRRCKEKAPYYPYLKTDLWIDVHHALCFQLFINPLTNKPK